VDIASPVRLSAKRAAATLDAIQARESVPLCRHNFAAAQTDKKGFRFARSPLTGNRSPGAASPDPAVLPNTSAHHDLLLSFAALADFLSPGRYLPAKANPCNKLPEAAPNSRVSVEARFRPQQTVSAFQALYAWRPSRLLPWWFFYSASPKGCSKNQSFRAGETQCRAAAFRSSSLSLSLQTSDAHRVSSEPRGADTPANLWRTRLQRLLPGCFGFSSSRLEKILACLTDVRQDHPEPGPSRPDTHSLQSVPPAFTGAPHDSHTEES